VFLNLLVNAAHAIKETVGESGARGRITVCSFTEGQSAVITVRDTGQGIAPEVSEHVFEQFFTTKEVGRGTGQGLAIAWRVVVERHGGTLSFETEVGVGTTFTVRIPLSAKVSSVLSEEPAQAA
jgi:signal transduction histidine kinase